MMAPPGSSPVYPQLPDGAFVCLPAWLVDFSDAGQDDVLGPMQQGSGVDLHKFCYGKQHRVMAHFPGFRSTAPDLHKTGQEGPDPGANERHADLPSPPPLHSDDSWFLLPSRVRDFPRSPLRLSPFGAALAATHPSFAPHALCKSARLAGFLQEGTGPAAPSPLLSRVSARLEGRARCI